MSRWSDRYTEFVESENWKEIVTFANRINLRNEGDSKLKHELARLRRITSLIEQKLKAIEPDLCPIDVWDKLDGYTSNCVGYLEFVAASIFEANNCLDLILGKLSPYALSEKKSAQAAGAAFREYSIFIEEAIESTETSSKSALASIDLIQEEVEASKDAIKRFEYKLLGEQIDEDAEAEGEEGHDDSTPLKQKFSDLFETFEEQAQTIETFFKRLTSGGTEEASVIKQINEAKEQAERAQKSAQDNLNSINEMVKSLMEYHVVVFGKPDENGKNQGGLKSEIDNRRIELAEFDDIQKDTFTSLREKIESLLPGATSAGLAAAYKELRKDCENRELKYSRRFGFTVFAISVVGVLPPEITNISDFFRIHTTDLNEILINLVVKLPAIMPIVWLAVFFSRRRSEFHRLGQEYAHKEALAKSYDGYKTQIESLQIHDEVLLSLLLRTAIDALGANAASTLDKRHGDKTPVAEIGEAATNFASNALRN